MYNPNTDADASIGRLQEAFNLVNDRTELKDIYTKAGGWKNIELKPIAGKQDEDGVKTAPTFEVINKKNPSEKVEVTENEFSLLGTINKMIPTSQTNDMKIIRIGEEAKPTAEAPAPTQAGIPANQITTTAPEIPEEAMALQKIVEQGQVAKAGESAKNVEKRIKDIDAQIKQLSSAYIQGSRVGGGMLPGGYAAPISSGGRQKTAEEAQADIQKISNLKTERELLFAKTEKAYNTAKSEGRVFQNAEEVKSSKKKFPAGTIIYIGTTPAKVK